MPTLQRGDTKNWVLGLSPVWKCQDNRTIFTCNGPEISHSIYSSYLTLFHPGGWGVGGQTHLTYKKIRCVLIRKIKA